MGHLAAHREVRGQLVAPAVSSSLPRLVELSPSGLCGSSRPGDQPALLHSAEAAAAHHHQGGGGEFCVFCLFSILVQIVLVL